MLIIHFILFYLIGVSLNSCFPLLDFIIEMKRRPRKVSVKLKEMMDFADKRVLSSPPLLFYINSAP